MRIKWNTILDLELEDSIFKQVNIYKFSSNLMGGVLNSNRIILKLMLEKQIQNNQTIFDREKNEHLFAFLSMKVYFKVMVI